MMEMPDKLRTLKTALSVEFNSATDVAAASERTVFRAGFDACWNELAPLVAVLKFYGYEAIHNPNSEDKSEQYWTDKGIYDHGEKAREALKKIGMGEEGETK